MTDVAFAILCVCTGNVCRSPAAERLLAHTLGPTVSVSSAGTFAVVDQGFSPPMDRLVQAAGAEPGGFRDRMLSPAILQRADLVLGLTREHRAAAVDLVPAAVRRTFTLREYARLLRLIDPGLLPGATPGARARAAVPLAAAQRRRVGAADDDVADPYHRGLRAYATAFAEIEEAVHDIAGVLRP